MSIDINDYTARLNSARQEYGRKADDLQRSYKKNVDNLKETHDYRTNSQRKAYNNQLSQIEEETGELNQELRENSFKNIKKMREDYTSSLESEKKAFQERYENLNEKLRGQLSQARDSYENSVGALKKQSEELNKNRDNDVLGRLYSEREQHSKDVDILNKKIQTTLKNLDKEKTAGRKMHTLETEKMLHDAQEKNAGKLSEMRNRYDKAFSELSTNYRKRESDMRGDHLNKQMNLSKNLKNDGAVKFKEYSEKMKLQEQKNKENVKNLRAEFNDNIKKNNEENQKEMGRVKLGYEKRLLDLEPFVENNNRKSIFNVNKKEISNLKRRVVSERENFKLEAEKLKKSTDDKIAEAKNRYQEKTIQREGEFNLKAKKVVDKVNREKEDLVENYNMQLAKTKSDRDRTLARERDYSRRRLEKKTNELGRQINIMDKTNKALIYDLQKTAGEEKSEIIKTAAKKLATEKEVLKKDLRGKYEKIVTDYESKIGQIANQNKMLKEDFESTVRTLESDKKIAIEDERRNSLEARKLLKANFVEELGKRELDFRRSLSKMKLDYEKRMKEERGFNERVMKNLASKMDIETRRNRTEHKKSIEKMEREYKKMIGDIQSANSFEKNRIISQYEEKLDNLKDVVKNEQEKLKDLQSSKLS